MHFIIFSGLQFETVVAKMESPVILISSDSSAPTSPVHEIGSKHTLDCTDKQQPGSATSSDTTTDYYTPINLRTQPKIEDGYHDLCATSSLCEVDSKDTVDRAEVQLSDSDARSDTSMDYYPPVNFVKQPVSKNKSEESDVSANCSAGLLQEAQKEVHQLMDFEDSDKL
jgi:hypothetical protein